MKSNELKKLLESLTDEELEQLCPLSAKAARTRQPHPVGVRGDLVVGRVLLLGRDRGDLTVQVVGVLDRDVLVRSARGRVPVVVVLDRLHLPPGVVELHPVLAPGRVDRLEGFGAGVELGRGDQHRIAAAGDGAQGRRTSNRCAERSFDNVAIRARRFVAAGNDSW